MLNFRIIRIIHNTVSLFRNFNQCEISWQLREQDATSLRFTFIYLFFKQNKIVLQFLVLICYLQIGTVINLHEQANKAAQCASIQVQIADLHSKLESLHAIENEIETLRQQQSLSEPIPTADDQKSGGVWTWLAGSNR